MLRRGLLSGFLALLVTACKNEVSRSGRKRKKSKGAGADGCSSSELSLARDGQCIDPSLQSSSQDENGPPSVQSSGAPSAGASASLVGLKVALDVGHGANEGGWEPGAINDAAKVQEYSLNAQEGQGIATQLRAKGAQVSVFNYGKGQAGLSLRAKGARASGHHIFVSLHHNAAGNRSAQGSEVWVHPSGSTHDKSLAQAIQSKMVQHVWQGNKQYDRGVKVKELGVLGGVPQNVMACCLTEAFFVSGSDVNAVNALSRANATTQAIVEGIEQYWKARSTLSLLDEDPFDHLPWPEDPDPEGMMAGH